MNAAYYCAITTGIPEMTDFHLAGSCIHSSGLTRFTLRESAQCPFTCRLEGIVGNFRSRMTTSEKVQEFCDRIASDFHPDKIIVFGSHAYGMPGPFSDLDLLVVMPFEGSPLQQAARIISRINPDIGIDLIVRTPAQVRHRLAIRDAFMREIVERGRVAYEADHA